MLTKITLPPSIQKIREKLGSDPRVVELGPLDIALAQISGEIEELSSRTIESEERGPSNGPYSTAVWRKVRWSRFGDDIIHLWDSHDGLTDPSLAILQTDFQNNGDHGANDESRSTEGLTQHEIVAAEYQ